MQMRTRGSACGPDQSDRLALLNRIARLYQRPLVVGISGHIAVAVVDLDRLAVAESIFRVRHHTRSHRYDFRTRGTREIDALMNGVVAIKRIGTLAEI